MSTVNFDADTMAEVLRELRYRSSAGEPRHPWLELQSVSQRLARGARPDSPRARMEALRDVLAALIHLEIMRLYGGLPPEGWQRNWSLLRNADSRPVEALATIYARFFAADQPNLKSVGATLGLPGSTVDRRQRDGLDLLARLLERAEGDAGRQSDSPITGSRPLPATVEASADAPADGPSKLPTAILHHLQRCVAEDTGPALALDQRFVGLTLMLDRGPDTMGERWQSQEPFEGGLSELLAEVPAPAFVLLGPPGSGKTSLLRRMELDAAQALLDGVGERIPFYVSLSQYPPDAEPPRQPLAWLEELWVRRAEGLPPLAQLLAQQRLLLLADGLNEMPHRDDDSYRDLLRGWKRFLGADFAAPGGNRGIFSCRSLDYSAALSTATVPVPQVTVNPMDDASMAAFLLRHGAPELNQERLGTDLWDLLRRPLMLRLLAEQAAQQGSLPSGRVGLISGFIRQALRRELERDHPLLRSGPLLSARDLRRVAVVRDWPEPHDLPSEGGLFTWLRDLAWSLQQRQASADGSQVHAPLHDLARLIPEAPTDDLLAIGGALGLLTEDLSRDEISFSHQIFQEYFAARQLARAPRPELVAQAWSAEDIRPSLADCIAELNPADPLPPLPGTGWEEAMLMAAPMAPEPDAFIAALIDVNLPLAARAALQPEMHVAPDLRLRLQRRLADRARDRSADLRARLAAAEVLGQLGDPRMSHGEGPEGAYLLPPWVRVPAGEHRLPGSDGEPPRLVALDEFLIGQFPVTNAEFACFIRAGGYHDERWWPEGLARDWFMGKGTNAAARRQETEWYHRFKEEPGLLEGFVDRGVMSQPIYDLWRRLLAMDEPGLALHLGDRYPDGKAEAPRYWRGETRELPNHPVIGVCQFEAEAYCRWLSAPMGTEYRLPSLAEWLIAGLQDPTADPNPQNEANVMEQHIRGTSPIGVFAWSGIWGDMYDYVGNVVEWIGTGTQSTSRGPLLSWEGHAASDCFVVSSSWMSSYTIPSLPAVHPVGLRVRDIGFRLARSAFNQAHSAR